MKAALIPFGAAAFALFAAAASAQEARTTVHPEQVLHRLSRFLTGACIEDVNHEIYGGIYSQMIFGESFQEPAPQRPPAGFTAYGGAWSVHDGVLSAEPGDGPKLAPAVAPFREGEVSVEIMLPDRAAGNAGVIVKLANPGIGADAFDGYEVSLDLARQALVLGRHRQNWEPISETPLKIEPGQWRLLTVRVTADTIEALVDGQAVVRYEDREHPLAAGGVALRPWQRTALYRNLRVCGAPIPFVAPDTGGGEVSGMWRAVASGGATGSFSIVTDRPFVGAQAQRMAFVSGSGSVGIENRGLKRQGMYFEKGKPYERCIWARSARPIDVFVSLESGDGARVLSEVRLKLRSGGWRRLAFRLKPNAALDSGRFAIRLKSPGVVDLGYAFLQPGAWGRFRGLPCRRDVVEGLIAQGITALRYGGSMINHPEYRWKKMIGPRDRRQPYHGTWYPYSTNGWGIIDFLNLCEAAGFLPIPAFNMGETPQDMADFIEYVNGPTDSEWGRKRAADGHPEPYRLTHIELGNEEKIDDAYFARFRALAEAIWEKDPTIILTVGDFAYEHEITDPFHITGSAAGLTTLEAHRQILALARQHDREVWFDVHLWTDGPNRFPSGLALPSYVQALEQMADGARFKVCVYELNAGNHTQRRALGNALEINALERIGERIAVVCSANCLQPDGQNDNGWDQGLLFLNPSRVWLQPPGYVTRMYSRSFQPLLVRADTAGDTALSVNACRSEDGSALVLRVVNPTAASVRAQIEAGRFVQQAGAAGVGAGLRQEARRERQGARTAIVETLAGALDARNTADHTDAIVPARSTWRVGSALPVPAWSVVVIRMEDRPASTRFRGAAGH